MKGDMKMLSSGVLRMMLFIMVWSIQGVEGKPMCDPEDHKYYHFQGNMCLQCDKCLPGEEAISLEDWNLERSNPEKGPTECRRCRKCQSGTYSDKRSYKCEPCRNCTLYNQYQVRQCTATSNTVCDGVRPTTPSCYFTRKNKLCQSGRNKSSQEVPPGSSESDLNSDVRIDMESEDIVPLLPPNSSCSQSCTKSLELEIHETNLYLEDSHSAGVPADDKDSLHDLDTDGPSGINFSGRIRFYRQWSYPFDEKNKRDYHGVMQKDQPLTAIGQVSKDDVSVEYRETTSILELTDKHLNRISKYLAVRNLFTNVARDFGMEEEDIQAVKIDCAKENSIKETAYQMLLQIKKKRGKITLQELQSSLQNHGVGVWEKVNKVLHQTCSKER
uniref:TNFR-Cys domain-containing protein n=1 Tax=Magallana gigas TaxID=29159 RepID=A0A8W8LDD0_MAGGI